MFTSRASARHLIKHAPSSTFGDSWDYDHETSTTAGADDSHYESSLETNPSFDLSTTSQPTTKLVPVSVTGVQFMLESHVFDKLKRLPWEWSATETCLFLSMSPELFEIILNHLVFETFPVTLDKTDIEELEPMATALGLYKLQGHLHMLFKHGHWSHGRRRQQPTRNNGDKTIKGSTYHWEKARRLFVNKKKHNSLHDHAMLNAEYLS